MVASIIPFPLARRTAFIQRHAARMAALCPASAETYLALQIRIQAQAMQRRGVAAEIIVHEQEAMQRAVLSTLHRIEVAERAP